MKTYTATTRLIDESKEDEPVRKIYFLEEDNRAWKEGEIATMEAEIKRFKKGSLETITCFPAFRRGDYKRFSFNPGDYSIQLPICAGSVIFPKSKNNDNIVLDGDIALDLTYAEVVIAGFDQILLSRGGLEAFKNNWYPGTMFESKKIVDLTKINNSKQ